jgi:hypothetical protein
MTSQTRCDLALVSCEGATYAIPQDGSSAAHALHRWADHARAEYLDVVVTAGTIVSGAVLSGGVLVECDMYGARVLVPRDVLEDVN